MSEQPWQTDVGPAAEIVVPCEPSRQARGRQALERGGIIATPNNRFGAAAQEAGVDGVLVVDYPPEESAEFSAAMKSRGLDPIFLLAPTSTEERIAGTAKVASGYVYYVSLKGVTGSAALDVDAVAARLPGIREKTGLPVGVGFGIRDAETAGRIARIADAVVIGSRIIEEIEKSTPAGDCAVACANVKALVAGIRAGMDAA